MRSRSIVISCVEIFIFVAFKIDSIQRFGAQARTMSGAELLAVVGCVAAVISAYNDGSELVKKVRERRRSKKALQNAAAPDSPTHDLERSLASGRNNVSDQYDRHYRRMGDPFATGDREYRSECPNRLSLTLILCS